MRYTGIRKHVRMHSESEVVNFARPTYSGICDTLRSLADSEDRYIVRERERERERDLQKSVEEKRARNTVHVT